MIVVDNRWTGRNGIGRYANEVLSRLSVPWVPIDPSGSPSSPADFLLKRVAVGGQSPAGVYTPGYNGFLRSVPQTITVHDLIHLKSPGSAKYTSYYELVLKPLLKKNRHVLTVSETSKSAIETWIDDPKVEVINAGEGSSPEFNKHGELYSSPRPYYLYVGNLRAHKNVATIVKAMKLVADSDLYIVSADRTGVEGLVARAGVPDRVKRFAGLSDTELARLYRGARATLQPSLLEGFGLPALESALCGTPVIYFEGCESVREICAGGGVSVANAKSHVEWSEAMTGIQEGQSFASDSLLPGDYSWERVGQVVSTTLERYL